tara:strand:- start:19013 stop:19573 length:561 start_codon:yes stop_codon:yes gene_type:complete
MKQIKSTNQKIETEQDIKELALRYLDKYQPSKKDLKLYLFRKIQANPFQLIPKNEIMTKIQSVIADLENLNVLNDELYSELKSKNFLKRGYSINKIRMHLINKGIDDKLLKETIHKITKDDNNPDFYSAIRICKKRRIGPYRPEANRTIFYKKDIGVLARNGFSYDLSKDILSLDKKELKVFEKKL